MTIRFQADADLNQIILLALLRRDSSIDFQSATAAGLSGVKDFDVLAKAAGQGRILVTHDHRTMPRHFSDFIRQQSSPGLLIVPQSLSVTAVVEDLLLIHTATEADEWVNRIRYLPL